MNGVNLGYLDTGLDFRVDRALKEADEDKRYLIGSARGEYAMALRKQGWTYSRLAEHFGVSLERARQIIKQHEARIAKQTEREADDLAQLGLSPRAENGLRRLRVTGIAQLTAMTEETLLSCRNFGVRTVIEIDNALAKRGLTRVDGPMEAPLATCPECGYQFDHR